MTCGRGRHGGWAAVTIPGTADRGVMATAVQQRNTQFAAECGVIHEMTIQYLLELV
jgi:hypothetical protein